MSYFEIFNCEAECSPLLVHSQMSAMTRSGPGQGQESGTQSKCLTWGRRHPVTGASALPLSVCSVGQLEVGTGAGCCSVRRRAICNRARVQSLLACPPCSVNVCSTVLLFKCDVGKLHSGFSSTVLKFYVLCLIYLISSITNSKKNKKKTSNQKAQEEYERIQAERAAKKQVSFVLKIHSTFCPFLS